MILQSQSINQWQNVSDICACEHEAIDWFMSCSLDISKEKKIENLWPLVRMGWHSHIFCYRLRLSYRAYLLTSCQQIKALIAPEHWDTWSCLLAFIELYSFQWGLFMGPHPFRFTFIDIILPCLDFRVRCLKSTKN